MIILCNSFLDAIYGDCVNTSTEYISIFFGISSILCWMCAQFPQLYTNYKLKRSESLSPIFLGCWLGGDLTNLIGCILTDQLPTQTYTAVYYIWADIMLISQAKYYWWVAQQRRKAAEEERKSLIPKTFMIGMLIILPGTLFVTSNFYSSGLNGPATEFGGSTRFSSSRTLLEEIDFFASTTTDSTTGTGEITTTSTGMISTTTEFSTTGSTEDDDDESDKEEYFGFDSWEDYVGYSIGWISAFIYLSSRVPQIYQNWQRKTTEGLSRLMFTFAVLGNVTYTISILVVSQNGWYLLGHLPWLLGSAGTLVFDATVFYQTYYYAVEKPVLLKERVVPSESISLVLNDESSASSSSSPSSFAQITDVVTETVSRDYIGLKKSYYYRIGIGMPPSAPINT